jgi:hypothetical protein
MHLYPEPPGRLVGHVDTAVAFACLLFGQTHPGDLRFAEDGERDALEVHAINSQPACQNRKSGYQALPHCRVIEYVASIYIPGSVDPRVARLQAVVDSRCPKGCRLSACIPSGKSSFLPVAMSTVSPAMVCSCLSWW